MRARGAGLHAHRYADRRAACILILPPRCPSSPPPLCSARGRPAALSGAAVPVDWAVGGGDGACAGAACRAAARRPPRPRVILKYAALGAPLGSPVRCKSLYCGMQASDQALATHMQQRGVTCYRGRVAGWHCRERWPGQQSKRKVVGGQVGHHQWQTSSGEPNGGEAAAAQLPPVLQNSASSASMPSASTASLAGRLAWRCRSGGILTATVMANRCSADCMRARLALASGGPSAVPAGLAAAAGAAHPGVDASTGSPFTAGASGAGSAAGAGAGGGPAAAAAAAALPGFVPAAGEALRRAAGFCCCWLAGASSGVLRTSSGC